MYKAGTRTRSFYPKEKGWLIRTVQEKSDWMSPMSPEDTLRQARPEITQDRVMNKGMAAITRHKQSSRSRKKQIGIGLKPLGIRQATQTRDTSQFGF